MSVSFFLPMEYIIWTYNIYNKSRQQWSEQLAYSPIYFFTHLLHYNNDPLLDRQQKWRTWCARSMSRRVGLLDHWHGGSSRKKADNRRQLATTEDKSSTSEHGGSYFYLHDLRY